MKRKTGLVLAGGGAKGAYQAGVLRYLAEINWMPDIIAGNSIGGLNGAILASSSSMQEAAKTIDSLWDELVAARVLTLNAKALADLLVEALSVGSHGSMNSLNAIYSFAFGKSDFSIFDPRPLDRFIRKALNIDKLRTGTELWVSVFPAFRTLFLSESTIDQLTSKFIDLARAAIKVKGEWLRVQDVDTDDQVFQLLLASAAVPFAFPTREVNNKHYVDGLLWDNVPVGALAAQGATHVIVVHIENGSDFDRTKFPNLRIIEIRPTQLIDEGYKFGSAGLQFHNPEYIKRLKERGYEDAKSIIGKVMDSLDLFQDLKNINNELIDSHNELIDSDNALDEALKLLD